MWAKNFEKMSVYFSLWNFARNQYSNFIELFLLTSPTSAVSLNYIIFCFDSFSSSRKQRKFNEKRSLFRDTI